MFGDDQDCSETKSAMTEKHIKIKLKTVPEG